MNNLFLCYPKCSTCTKARKWLEEKNISFEQRDIKENNPNVEELTQWIEKSNLPVKKFFNTSGIKYRELNLKDKLPKMTDQEKIEVLSTDGMLVKRPIFISEKGIVIGFKEAEWDKQLSE